jgi:hypothetical protein
MYFMHYLIDINMIFNINIEFPRKFNVIQYKILKAQIVRYHV